MPFLLLIFSFLFLQSAHADVRFLTISDFHYGNDNIASEGQDTDKILLSSSLKKFSELTNDVDFILTLGDFPTHMWGASPTKAEYIKTVFHALFNADTTAKPMFFISGNNDSLRGNYQPFSLNNKSPLTLATDWQGACVHCEGLILDGSEMFTNGYYSSYVVPNNKDIILIVLNSTQFNKNSFFIPTYPNQDKDALQQLKWLENQLKKYHAKQLLIAMHIPPGTDYKGHKVWHEAYLKHFIYLLNLFDSQYGQITLLTAHTHMDDIRKIHLENGKNIYAFATPSISRIHYNYPAMKLFFLDKDMGLKDYTTYYTTHSEKWEDNHYNAVGTPDSVFPQCHSTSLDQCLDTLSNGVVCKRLEEGQFYGVKNPRVNSSVCKLTYPIN
jgi:hypothetical protein